MHASQSGLGLPDRAYYFKTDSSTVGIQNAYKTYVATLFGLTDIEGGPEKAETVYGIEKQLAEAHKTRKKVLNFAHSRDCFQ